MTGSYKVRVKKGEYEIEIESSDKAYVDAKLGELLDSVPKTESPVGETKRRKKTAGKSAAKSKANSPSDNDTAKLDVAGLVAHIKDAEDYDDVETNIIDKRDVLAKIIMCLHYAAEYLDDPHLTTGQIEAITNQLGIKIALSNASNKITSNQRYFTGKTVRRPGQAVPYKLNRKGENAFKKYLKGEKP